MNKQPIAIIVMILACIGIYAYVFLKWQGNQADVGGRVASGSIPIKVDAADRSAAHSKGRVGSSPFLDAGREVPEGYQQVIPRGAILAIDEPEYVSASEAKISDETYVLGVLIEGQALAYSLNLLNSHEIVNDTVGSTNFAAVW